MGALMNERRKFENDLMRKLEAEKAKRKKLEAAIKRHHVSVGADDWSADETLWSALSLPAHPR